MKKKIALIATVILLSLGLLSISKFVQDKYLNKNSVSIEQQAKEKTPTEANASVEINAKEENKDKQGDVVTESDANKEEVKPIVKEGTTTTNTESKAGAQQKNTVNTQPVVKNSKANSPSTESVKIVKNTTKDQVVKIPSPKKEPNLIIKDDISGKVILSINISTDNKTVAQITLSELDNSGISYKATGRGEAVYFTMINSLKARDFGPLSGWCYYVNGSKASISCGAYKLKSSDVVEWKYLEDGVNN